VQRIAHLTCTLTHEAALDVGDRGGRPATRACLPQP
jgi:hypothetical protein